MQWYNISRVSELQFLALQYRQWLLDCTLCNAFASFICFSYWFYYFMKAMYVQVMKWIPSMKK